MLSEMRFRNHYRCGINRGEDDPKVTGLPSLLFISSIPIIQLDNKNIAILLKNKGIAIVYLGLFYYL